MAPYDFNAPDADTILRSSDGKEFRVHRVILSLASTVFQGMFCLPQSTDPPLRRRPLILSIPPKFSNLSFSTSILIHHPSFRMSQRGGSCMLSLTSILPKVLWIISGVYSPSSLRHLRCASTLLHHTGASKRRQRSRPGEP